jgi:hypothetical protein
MNIYMYFISPGLLIEAPVILVTLFLYKGTAESRAVAFLTLYLIGLVANTTAILLYTS